MGNAEVLECALCGARLASPRGEMHVFCRCCESDNRLIAAGADPRDPAAPRLAVASKELAEVRYESRQKMGELNAKLETAIERGDHESAIRHFEGLMRLQTAGARHHLNRHADSEQSAARLAQMDAHLEQSVREFAEQLGARPGTTTERPSRS